MRDIRVWEPDESCEPWFLDYASDNPSNVSFDMIQFRVPQSHVCVITDILTGQIDSNAVTPGGANAKATAVIDLLRGDLGASLTPYPIQGAALNLVQFSAALNRVSNSFVCHSIDTGPIPCRIVLEPGPYLFRFQNIAGVTTGAGVRASGYVFPLRPAR